MDSGLAEVDGGKLAWESAGEGPDVVFLHPGLWDSRVWDQQFGLFEDLPRREVRPPRVRSIEPTGAARIPRERASAGSRSTTSM